jgi:hypothetical protein
MMLFNWGGLSMVMIISARYFAHYYKTTRTVHALVAIGMLVNMEINGGGVDESKVGED